MHKKKNNPTRGALNNLQERTPTQKNNTKLTITKSTTNRCPWRSTKSHPLPNLPLHPSKNSTISLNPQSPENSTTSLPQDPPLIKKRQVNHDLINQRLIVPIPHHNSPRRTEKPTPKRIGKQATPQKMIKILLLLFTKNTTLRTQSQRRMLLSTVLGDNSTM